MWVRYDVLVYAIGKYSPPDLRGRDLGDRAGTCGQRLPDGAAAERRHTRVDSVGDHRQRRGHWVHR
ncbi:MAG TPA: hypothetical protein VL634_26385, partial [Mycobacterium sp.]|nr:hypothetical protein [Mycobacterium sp.]